MRALLPSTGMRVLAIHVRREGVTVMAFCFAPNSLQFAPNSSKTDGTATVIGDTIVERAL